MDFDSQSYCENFKKLKNLVAKNGNKDNIINLFNITQLDRRQEIKEGSYLEIYNFMKNHCPVLKEVYFLSNSNNFCCIT
jgi:hypothetical protein